MFLNAHYCIGCPFLKNARSGLCWKYKERVYGLTGFRGVLFKEGPPPWIATVALFFPRPVPLSHRRDTSLLLATANTAGDSGVAWVFFRIMAQAWSGRSSKKKGQMSRNG